jgi:hypothetical protein
MGLKMLSRFEQKTANEKRVFLLLFFFWLRFFAVALFCQPETKHQRRTGNQLGPASGPSVSGGDAFLY